MEYKDPSGKVLYGFSQENLEKTNREIRKTNRLLQLMVVMMVILMLLVIAALFWFDYHNVITKIIFGI